MTTPRKHYSLAFKAQVVQEVLEGNRTIGQIASDRGIHPNNIAKWKRAALKAMPASFDESDGQANQGSNRALRTRKNRALSRNRLSNHRVKMVGKKVRQGLPRSIRLALLEREPHEAQKTEVEFKPRLPLSRQSELLGISHSSLYYRPVGPSEREIKLKHRIDEIYTAYPFYGYRRIHAQMSREGTRVNRKTVQSYMREMGLEAIYPGLNLSKRDLQHRVYPYLLRNFVISRPVQVFGTDIIYIRLAAHGWLYLIAVIDWYSRYVVSWELSDTLEIEFVLKALERALAAGRPEILNSDQGTHFTSPQYLKLVHSAGVKVSMDGRGRALDNVFTERLWRSLKYECAPVKGLNASEIVSSNLAS